MPSLKLLPMVGRVGVRARIEVGVSRVARWLNSEQYLEAKLDEVRFVRVQIINRRKCVHDHGLIQL